MSITSKKKLETYTDYRKIYDIKSMSAEQDKLRGTAVLYKYQMNPTVIY